ncbi:MAG: oxaloacetate decarboxylase [Acidaminococcaceae bacterium]|jgi:2-methylisocitrate lyase-like PEP mutase family enzyme|nr:oxaloacetate decarboxylase [Acidaminococcaceae bacterium]
MKTAHQKRLDFRARLKSKKIMIVPGIYDALSAKIAQEAGIPCIAMGGYSIEASRLAQPDVGLLSLSEMTTALKQICDAIDIPVIGDGDTGYGNALNAIRTEQEFEAAGAACVFLEDQVWPKRCGHMDGKQVITAEEHAQKLRAAVDARVDKSMMIMARTDTRAINGLDDAIERGKRYADAGAEIIFIEALRDRAEIEKAARAFEGTGIYLTSNMIEGGKTPLIPAKELEQMGYSVVFWACSALYLVSKTLHDAFTVLNTTGTTASLADKMIDFPRFNHFIGLDTYKKLEREYKVDRDD